MKVTKEILKKYFKKGAYPTEQDFANTIDSLAHVDETVSPEIVEEIYKVIESKAEADSVNSHFANYSNPHRVTKEQIGLGNVDNTADMDKPISNSTAQELATKASISDLQHHVSDTDVHTNTEEKTAWNAKETPENATAKAEAALEAAKVYTDTSVANLVNSSPEALDTLKELADALGNDANFSETVLTEIGKKASASDLQSHVEASDIHTTQAEKTAWDAKESVEGAQTKATDAYITATAYASTAIEAHAKLVTHITPKEREDWNAKAASVIMHPVEFISGDYILENPTDIKVGNVIAYSLFATSNEPATLIFPTNAIRPNDIVYIFPESYIEVSVYFKDDIYVWTASQLLKL